MHIVKDENGNICAHAHGEHTHTHTHDGADSCSSGCNGCGHAHEEAGTDKNTALLTYMLQHNKSHAVELDQMAEKLGKDGLEEAAGQIRKAVDEFEKGNLYLSLALSMVKEKQEV